MINNLTVVIPTQNRPQHLNRLLNCIRERVHILVADSSDLRSGSGVNTTSSLLVEKFDVNTSFSKKIYEALKIVETPYVQLCADDDFPILSTSERCMQALENDPKISAICGLTIAFSQNFAGICTWPRYLDKAFWRNNENQNYRRFLKSFTDYYQFFYGVHRSDLLRQIFKFSSQHVHKRGWEMDVTLMSSLTGNQLVLKTVGSAREAMAPALQLDTNPSVNEWINTHYDTQKFEAWARAYQQFADEIQSGEDFQEIEDLIRKPIFNLQSNGLYPNAYKVFGRFFLRDHGWPPSKSTQRKMWCWDYLFINGAHRKFLLSKEWQKIKENLDHFGPLDQTKYGN